jgi:hypothetical protein
MSEPNDDLKNILGEELFDELNSLDPHDGFPEIDEAKLIEISLKGYQATIEFGGEQALDLVAALFHAADEKCEECKDHITRFSGSVIGSMWMAILASEGLIESE